MSQQKLDVSNVQSGPEFVSKVKEGLEKGFSCPDNVLSELKEANTSLTEAGMPRIELSGAELIALPEILEAGISKLREEGKEYIAEQWDRALAQPFTNAAMNVHGVDCGLHPMKRR